MNLEIFRDLTEATRNVVRGVKPEQLGARTPCADWDVSALANHLLQVMTALRLAGKGDPIPDELWGSDLMTPDWAQDLEREAEQALSLPIHENAMAAMLAGDLVLHGWDLARATGQDFAVGEAAAAVTFEFVAASAEQGRAMKIYGEPVPVADDAPLLERAIGLSGRDPGWHPHG